MGAKKCTGRYTEEKLLHLMNDMQLWLLLRLQHCNMMDLRTRSRVNPFYVPPSCIIKTTSEIISEARLAMSNSAVGRPVSNAMRPIQTQRPFTPREGQRTLFGLSNSRTLRPPSAISVRHVKFQDVEAMPKLPSLRPVLRQLNFPGHRSPWHLPAIRDSVRKQKPIRPRASLDNLPEEVETETSVEGFHNSFVSRETHSSPKERTDLSDDGEPTSIIRKKQKKPILEAGLRRSWVPPNLYGIAIKTLENLSIDNDKRRAKPNPQLLSQYSPLKTEGAKFVFASIINEADEAIEYNDQITNEENRKIEKFVDPKRNNTETRTKLSSFQQSFVSPSVMAIDEMMDAEEAVDIMSHENLMNEAKVASKLATESDFPEKFETVESLLTTLAMIEEPDVNKSDLIPKLDSLACALEREEVVTLRKSKVQTQVLKTLYRFVELADETVLLYIARVILTMRVSGPNLSAVCKLIFKVSRCDQNDQLFQEGDILGLFLESLGRASPLEDAEACIYGYGALKFLTMNNKLLDASLKLGTLPLMVLHLKIVNNARLELVPIPEQTSHAVFQLTGALRNMASEQATFPEFIQTGAIAELCRAMELFCADIDLVANTARTLSILSTDDECCQVIGNCDGSLRTIVKIFAKFPGRQDIVVRLGYALGNLMAKCNSARLKLFEEPGALSSILTLVENYLEKDLQLMCSKKERTQLVGSPEWGSDGSVEDVIVKMIRIVANMCMHSQVGMGLTCGFIDSEDEPYNLMDPHCTKDGGRFLDILLTVMRRKSVTEHDELILSTLSTLNNLSFYSDPVCIHNGPFALRQMDIAQDPEEKQVQERNPLSNWFINGLVYLLKDSYNLRNQEYHN